ARVLAAERSLRRAVFHKVARHPVILALRGKILHRLAPIAAMQLRAALARRTHQYNCEPSIERHGDQRGLAITRHAFDADSLRIHRLFRFQIIQAPRSSPSPRTKRAPVVRLASLSFVREPNNSFRKPSAVVGLNTSRIDRRISPTRDNELLGRRRSTRKR